MFGRTIVRPLQGAVVALGGQITYVVVPCNGLRFKSKAVPESRCRPWVHIVPMLRVVFSKISRSICKLACNIQGSRNCGETREMSSEAPNSGELPGRIFGNVGVCWF